ncbi:MAG TPA: DUF2182 domain-containing protein [Ktedonobacterales bacterium]
MLNPYAGMPTRERNVILLALVGLSAAAWVVVFWQARGMSGAMGLTMGLDVALFLAIWIAMMVAMMFPSAAPMILMFGAISAGKRRQGQAATPTAVFVGGYLFVWTAFGALAWLLASGADLLASRAPWLMANGARIGGVALVAAGLYQVTPLKRVCLTKCRTPMQFVLGSWRDGAWGALRMGVEHGAFCLGCCWWLMVILFPLGVMNVVAMGLLTALIFAEKVLPVGRLISWLAAAGLVIYGAVVIVAPMALPALL